MLKNIPQYLFRGDSDNRNRRNLRHSREIIQLQTDLLKGGNGHVIFNTPLAQLINNHVRPGWMNTHFLSFTENEITACRFGLHCDRDDQVEDLMQPYRDYYEDGSEWHFAVVEINTSMIDWNEFAPGVYQGTHAPSLLKFKEYPGVCSVMLINVSEAVKPYSTLPDYNLVISNAKRDKEWLIIPTTPTKLNNHKIEYTGILDGYFISDVRKFIKS